MGRYNNNDLNISANSNSVSTIDANDVEEKAEVQSAPLMLDSFQSMLNVMMMHQEENILESFKGMIEMD